MRRSSSRWAGASVVWAVAVAMAIGERSSEWRSLAPPAPARGSSTAPAGRRPRDDSPSRGRGGGAQQTRRVCSSARSGDVGAQDVDILTIGQYLRPSSQHLPIARYYTPDEFARRTEVL